MIHLICTSAEDVNIMLKLRLTHIAQMEGDDRYYIRFTSNWSEEGEQAWNAFKNVLKASKDAWWRAKFTFNDGKKGGWYISAELLAEHCQWFSNYHSAMEHVEIHVDPIKEKAKAQDVRLLYAPEKINVALQIS